ncbi:MAG: cupredoxin domain-containing protein [Actinomycetota bacterium]
MLLAPRPQRLTIVALVATMSLVPATSARGDDRSRVQGGPEIVSGPAAQFYGYATPAMVVEKGGSLAYTNLDLVQHDVVHDVGTDGVSRKKRAPWCKRFDQGQCPIFWSNRAGLGSTVKVKGLNGVKPGEIYTFLCTLHPGMKGQLVVAN